MKLKILIQRFLGLPKCSHENGITGDRLLLIKVSSYQIHRTE
jgi:hypothetical protein